MRLVELEKSTWSPWTETKRAENSADFSFRSPNRLNTAARSLLKFLYQELDKISGINSSWQKLSENEDIIIEEILAALKKTRHISSYRLGKERLNDAPAFYSFNISHSFSAGLTDGIEIKKTFSHGFSKSKDLAYARGIGEFFERYAFTLYKNSDFIHASEASLSGLGKKFVPLAEWAGFSEKQKINHQPYQFYQNSVLSWTVGSRISTGKKILLPAQRVFWNYKYAAGEPILAEPNTNGCGGMLTKEEAILSALYELVQRDAFLLKWMRRESPPRVDVNTLPDERIRSLAKEGESYGFKTHILNITSNLGIPAFAAVIEDLLNAPKFAVGAGCEADPLDAIYHAMEEAWAVYYFLRSRKPHSLPADYKPYVSPLGKKERLLLWANPEMEKEFLFFLQGKSVVLENLPKIGPFSSKKEELRETIRRIETLGKGYEVYCFLNSHPLLKSFQYYAARILVPQLVPFYLEERLAPLGSKRIGKVENSLPHPFP